MPGLRPWGPRRIRFPLENGADSGPQIDAEVLRGRRRRAICQVGGENELAERFPVGGELETRELSPGRMTARSPRRFAGTTCLTRTLESPVLPRTSDDGRAAAGDSPALAAEGRAGTSVLTARPSFSHAGMGN